MFNIAQFFSHNLFYLCDNITEFGIVDNNTVIEVEVDGLDGDFVETVVVFVAFIEGDTHLGKI